MNARARVTRRTGPWLGRLSPRAQILLSGRPPVEIDGQRLDPEVQLLLSLRERMQPPIWDASMTVERGRAVTREEAWIAAGPRAIEVAEVRDLTAAGLRARLYVPDEPGPHPLLVYFHGGGFVAGDLDTHDAPCRVLCRHGGVRVLSVDYRLAPEHPFPAWVEDALAAYDWACENAAALGADPRRVAVSGDSAGGNLAALIAQERRPGPALQLLIYPSVDMTRMRRSHELFGDGFFLTSALIEWYAGHFLPEGADAADIRRSPLLAPDVSGVAPAIVVNAGFDPLRDEGEAYAARLRDAGVPVLAHRFRGLFHGFINSVGVSPACRGALTEVAGMLRAQLAAQAQQGDDRAGESGEHRGNGRPWGVADVDRAHR
ncbi:alpha/beta hydrolase [Candidatus Solirubrobacter pratensis]|uniref:alpha/beta hydrolase n=1 Tax=Candidatus Solirubrobacter pratensis TaxID=1298857 RepID=UPI0003F75A5D|nr:alpha/beta hydrolase [Candidatus Solirubrobacter pratensis]